MKVYGPYTRKDGRQHVILYQETTKQRRTVSYPKYLMENALGRELKKWETVDHIDGDFTNNDLTNLQILSREDNITKSALGEELYWFNCPICGKYVSKSASQVRHNRKMGKAGPFCGKSCSGKYSHTV